jgi:hypothetical protein
MNDARDITQQRQQDIQPELLADSYLEKNPQWREQYGDQNS